MCPNQSLSFAEALLSLIADQSMVTTRSSYRASDAFEQPHLDSPSSRATRSLTKAPPSSAQKKETNNPPSSHRPSHQAATAHDHEEYEFFGPHVPFLLLFLLPAVLYALIFACNKEGCFSLYPLPIKPAPGFPSGSNLFSLEACVVYSGWFFGLVFLHLLIPGTIAQGTTLRDGSRLSYKLNGERNAPPYQPCL